MFLIGDKVIVKRGLDIGEDYNDLLFTSIMSENRGKVCEVTNAYYDEETEQYVCELDYDDEYLYNKEMLEYETDNEKLTNIIKRKVGKNVQRW